MKNVVILNNGDCGSTGNIAVNLHRELLRREYNSLFCYGRGKKSIDTNTYRIGSICSLRLHVFMTRISGLQGFYSIKATHKLLKMLKQRNVDTIYIVCIHGYYINERLLYQFIADNHIRLVHIMIDEYAYTGKCAYRNGCERYLYGCGHCPHKYEYPASKLFDGSRTVFSMKKVAYSKLDNAIFVGPEFVVKQAEKSPLFLDKLHKGVELSVLDEAIDTDIYYPRNTLRLKKELGISNEKIIVSCVVPYDGSPNDRKGGRFFIELARIFEDDSRYVFIHVGYRNKRKEDLPVNFMPIGFVSNQDLLAEYFSIGDLFVFPSLLDTMPNACLDSLACGTPLLAFNVSGMPYMANEEVGTFVEAGNVDAFAEIVNMSSKKTESIIRKCRDYALLRYDSRKYNEKLIKLGNI